jgi:hypothetical protein
MAETILKKRKIALAGPIGEEHAGKIIRSLSQKQGILACKIDKSKGTLNLEYNLLQIKFETIENSIKDLGFQLSGKIREKLKRGMAKFTEQNELDNLAAPSLPCCSDPEGHKARMHDKSCK